MKSRERVPVLALVRERRLGLGHEHRESVVAQRPQELLLAPVPRVQRADPDPGVLGDGGDRRCRVGDEHLPGGCEDLLVVARRLGAAAGQR